MSSKIAIKQMVNQLLDELIDEKTRQQLGTSIEQNMEHEYEKKLEKRFYELKSEFNEIDVNGDYLITIDELYAFFQKKNPNIKKSEIQSLFELSDRDKNSKITINEFVYMYVLLEERLKLKRDTLMEVRDNFLVKLEKYKNKKQILIDDNINGKNDDNEIRIKILEANGLKSSQGAINSQILLSLIDKYENIISQQQGRQHYGESNPKFNENFTFYVQDYSNKIKCELIDPSNITKNGFGNFIINTEELMDQLKHDNWYKLINNNGTNGSIHVESSFIYDKVKYYEELINKSNEQIEKLNDTVMQISDLANKFSQPFGLLYLNKIQDIINQKIFVKSENAGDYLTNSKIFVYSDSKNNRESNITKFTPNEKEEEIYGGITNKKLSIIHEEMSGPLINSNLINEVTNNNNFETGISPYFDKFDKFMPNNQSLLGKKCNQLIFIGSLVTLLSFFWKVDIYNLILYIFGLAIIYNFMKINNRMATKKIFIYGLIFAIFFDVIWMFLPKQKGRNEGFTLSKGMMYGLNLLNMAIKCWLVYLITKDN